MSKELRADYIVEKCLVWMFAVSCVDRLLVNAHLSGHEQCKHQQRNTCANNYNSFHNQIFTLLHPQTSVTHGELGHRTMHFQGINSVHQSLNHVDVH